MYWDTNNVSFSGGTNATGIALADGSIAAAGVQATINGINGAQSFSPNPITASTGQPITWHNADGLTHRLVANDNSFDTGNISGGATSTAVTPHAGAVPYHCSIHPSMTGTINVSGQ
jgi:plastocyanin